MAVLGATRHLVPAIVVIFFFFSALGCLTPFLSLHMRDLGLWDREIVIINGASAFLSLLLPPFFGWIADRRAKYKTLTIISLFLSGLAYTGLLFIPRAFRSPRSPMMEYDCVSGVVVEKCESWSTCSGASMNPFEPIKITLSNCRYHCPYNGGRSVNTSLPLHLCFRATDDSICLVYDPLSETNATLSFRGRLTSDIFHEFADVPTHPPNSIMQVCAYRIRPPLDVNGKKYVDSLCQPVPDGCSVRCRPYMTITDKRETVKPATCIEVIGDPTLTFWAYFGVRAIADACLLTALCLLDGLVVSNTNDFDGAFGRTRLWAALPMAIFPPVTGVLVDYYSEVAGRADYSPAIFIFDGLALITCALVVAMPMNAGSRAKYVITPDVRKNAFWTSEMVFLLFLVLILGVFWGYLEIFLPLMIITEMGSSKLIYGVTLSITFGCSLPFLGISKLMVRNIGRAHLLVFAFLFYGLRFGGLSFVTDPYWTFPFEAMKTFTLCVMWLGAISYGHSLVSRSSHLIIHYTLILIHFAVGRGTGAILGGFGGEIFGHIYVFRGFGIFSTVVGLLYLVIYHCCLKTIKSHSSKQPSLVAVNGGSWYHMNDGGRPPNGDAHAIQPMMFSGEEDSDVGGFIDDD